MEEVDEIVLHTLRQIGCEVSEFSSLREFTTEAAIEGVVRCLKLVNPSLELSHKLPSNMSARYRLGSTLAQLCTELGYKGEIGYQTFMYSNETDLRKIFLFLFENLPKESEKTLDEPLSKISSILKEARSSLSTSLNSSWVPFYCKGNPLSEGKLLLKNPVNYVPLFLSKPLFKGFDYNHLEETEHKMFCENQLPVLPCQVSDNFHSSMLERNALDYIQQLNNEYDESDLTAVLNKKEILLQKKGRVDKTINDFLQKGLLQENITSQKYNVIMSNIYEGSRFKHATELQFSSEKIKASEEIEITKEDSKEEQQKKREAEIKSLQDKLDNITSKLENLLSENKKFEISSQNATEHIKKVEESMGDMKEKFRVKKATLSLLPDAESNIAKLQALIDASSERLVSLANQWEHHRVPLIEQYNELCEQSSKKVNETQRKLEEIKSMREKMKDLAADARLKDEMHKSLAAAYEKLTKDVSRSAYTRRIMEIVGNIKKQKAEIDKILLDTRNVQKEINSLNGKLERTFTVTDELIFKDAKKDEAVRRAYKFLAALHENSNQLVQIVEETGAIVREIREIEDQIEQENRKNVAGTLERITSDYKQMQKENETLMAQLK